MTNGDLLRSANNEELAEFLADECFRLAKHIFDACGYGVEKQVIYERRLQWLNTEVECSE